MTFPPLLPPWTYTNLSISLLLHGYCCERGWIPEMASHSLLLARRIFWVSPLHSWTLICSSHLSKLCVCARDSYFTDKRNRQTKADMKLQEGREKTFDATEWPNSPEKGREQLECKVAITTLKSFFNHLIDFFQKQFTTEAGHSPCSAQSKWGLRAQILCACFRIWTLNIPVTEHRTLAIDLPLSNSKHMVTVQM